MREGLEVVQGGDRAGWLAAPPSDYDDEGAPLWHEAEQFFNHCSWAVDVDETINMDTCSECSDGLSGDEDILPVDDALEADTTAEAYHSGKDMQGIPWEDLQPPRSRQEYRDIRMQSYPNYQNLGDVCTAHKDDLEQELLRPETGCTFFDFFRSYRCVQSSVVHFQLRHLLWATSGVDVYVQNNNTVSHWNLATRTETKVLDAATMHRCNSSLGKVQLSTLCVKHGLVAAGGFNGELLVRRLSEPDFLCGMRVTLSDNGITNGIEMYQSPTAALHIATSNNDGKLRLFDAESAALLRTLDFDFAVNYSAVNQPQGKLLCLVGDDPDALVVDVDTGRTTHELHGHYDYSFAAAWHPDGHVVATGNQDKTLRVWDLRYPSASLAVLEGSMAAIRSLQFSSDGRFLAAAEPADFVHVFDVGASLRKAQTVDIFGEVSGLSFSPDAGTLFVAIADPTYGSLLQLDRVGGEGRFATPAKS